MVGVQAPFMVTPLNESPSEKEGKYTCFTIASASVAPSMKVPPKRKGNNGGAFYRLGASNPQ